MSDMGSNKTPNDRVKEQIAQNKFGKSYDECTAHERVQIGGTKGGIVTKVGIERCCCSPAAAWAVCISPVAAIIITIIIIATVAACARPMAVYCTGSSLLSIVHLQ